MMKQMKWWMKKIWLKFSVVSICLLLATCASSAFYPLPDSQVMVDDTFAIIRTDSVMVVVRPESAMLDSPAMSQNYFVMHVQIRNLSHKIIPLRNMQVAVVSEGFQFDPLPLSYLLQLLRLDMMVAKPFDPLDAKPAPVSIEDHQNAYAALMMNYLVFSDLLPGSAVEGYLYFSNSLKGASRFILHMGQWAILFERRQTSNK